MSQMYPMGDGGQMALYQEGNRVMAAPLPYRRPGPAVQKRDCLEELTSAWFQGRIYFAYCNLEHQVAVDAVGGGQGKIVLTERREESRFCGLFLTVREGQLVLLYQAWNPERGAYELRAAAPYLAEPARRVGGLGENPGRCRLLEWQGRTLLLAEPEAGGESRLFLWESLWEWQELAGKPWELEQAWQEGRERRTAELAGREEALSARGEELSVREEALSARAEELSARGEELSAREAELAAREAEQSSREEELAAREAALSEQEEGLRSREAALADPQAEYRRQVEALRQEYEAQLDRARVQYQELAGMAAQLQQIGKMWRDKCYQMEGRDPMLI